MNELIKASLRGTKMKKISLDIAAPDIYRECNHTYCMNEMACRSEKTFIQEMKLRGYSKRTIEDYVYHNKKFLKYIRIVKVLTKEEILSMIEATNNSKHKLLIELLYSSGLRIGECLKVKIEDFDLEKKLLLIKRGKGKKDRWVVLSNKFIEDFDKYMSSNKINSDYLFSGRKGRLTERSAQEILKKAAKRAGIDKNVFPYKLRASYATHLIQNGTKISKVQKLMGHSRTDTTIGYISLSTKDIENITSPLDFENL